jgi:CubicO group peptidase (beta-lactamase class C family)
VRTRIRSVAVPAALVATATFAIAENKAQAIDGLIARYQQAGEFNGTALVGSRGTVLVSKGYGYADFEWTGRVALDALANGIVDFSE